MCTLAAKVFSGEVQRREAGIELKFFEFPTFWFCKQQLESTLAPSCEQTLAKTDQRASNRAHVFELFSPVKPACDLTRLIFYCFFFF